ncbi:MAG: CaiB/BaiF CoA transferase family protein, partial [Desertimonas sp.]
TGPFDGIEVIEIGQFVAVPACGQHLADGGARVIKVEPVTGDPYRSISNTIAPGESRHFITTNRGKQSVALDFTTPAGREIIEALVARADVVLTNLSPSALRRHHLRDEDLRPLNPALVYGVVAGWGFDGPDAQRPAMDAVAQAASGLMWALGAFDADGIPRHSEVPVADYTASTMLLAGVTTALLARQRDPEGRGQKVEVSLLGAALSLQNSWFSAIERFDAWRDGFVDTELPEMRRRGAHPDEIEQRRARRRPDPLVRGGYRVLRTSDGYLSVGAASAPGRARLIEALGLVHLDGVDDDEGTLRQIDDAARRHTTEALRARLDAAGVGVSAVRHPEELVADERLYEQGLVADFDHQVLGRYRSLVSPIGLSRDRFVARQPAPLFGASTREVLRELGRDDTAIDELVAAGAVADRWSEQPGDPGRRS